MNTPELKFTKIQKTSEKSLQKPIDEWVEDVSTRFEKVTGVVMDEAELSVLRSALSYRIEQFKDWENFAGSVFDDITGVYAVKDDMGGQYLIEPLADQVILVNKLVSIIG